jgi:DNA replication and repair protein RecF
MLKKLELENFRNYQGLRLDFRKDAGLTYLIGDNGEGKTNVLEAIYMLALAKSFRVSDQESLIKWSADFGRIKGGFDSAVTGETALEVFLGKEPQPARVFKVNGVKSSAVNFVGRIRVVFFHPEDLNALYLGPDLRRRYLDIMILQKSREYFEAIRKFKRLREQRNALLGAIREGMGKESDLDVWDEQLVREGTLIWRKRAEALSYINAGLPDKYEEISGVEMDLIGYTSNLAEIYGEELRRARVRDIASGRTQVGPHRDEIEFELGGKPILKHASRGEFRTILLALKLIEMDYFSEDGERPILLLDDVFSELDHERQRFLLEKVVDYQTFITTTKDSAVINQEKLLAGDFVEIVAGAVVK